MAHTLLLLPQLLAPQRTLVPRHLLARSHRQRRGRRAEGGADRGRGPGVRPAGGPGGLAEHGVLHLGGDGVDGAIRHPAALFLDNFQRFNGRRTRVFVVVLLVLNRFTLSRTQLKSLGLWLLILVHN